MQAKEKTLEPLLEGQMQYLVPLYQRTYARQCGQPDRLWHRRRRGGVPAPPETAPFDDSAVRDELRRRIKIIPGVAFPMSRLELRPSFPIERLADGGLDAAIDAHTCFLAQFLAP